MNDIGELLSIKLKISERQSLYNPNVVANLSKEMDEIYLVRKSVHENLLKFLENKDIDAKKVIDYINDQIKKCNSQLKEAKDDSDIKSIETEIDEKQAERQCSHNGNNGQAWYTLSHIGSS